MYYFRIITLFLLTDVQEHGFKVFGQLANLNEKNELVAGVGLFPWPPSISIPWPEKHITVINRANNSLSIWCSSKDNGRSAQDLNSGQVLELKIKLWFTGDWTVYWCTVDFMGFWARFDIYGRYAKYGFNNANDPRYYFKVFNDGVYYKRKKIRGLASGQNKYQLWESYDSNRKGHGPSLTGFVDHKVCNDIPEWMADRTSAVTVCDKACVILYSELHCEGETSVLHAKDVCTTYWLSYFNDRAKSVKGC